MISEDNIATAQIAQLFGSELLRVQEGARTDSGSQPNILNINPKQFLIPEQTTHYRTAKKADEERIVKMLQQEAEAAYPAAPVEQQPASAVPLIPQPVQQHNPPQSVSAIGSGDALERIASSLERIAIRFESVDLSVKKRKIKRTIK